MKKLMIALISLTFVLTAGCSNTELQKCQLENEKVKTALAECKKKSAQDESNWAKFIDIVMQEAKKARAENKECQDKLNLLTEENQALKQKIQEFENTTPKN